MTLIRLYYARSFLLVPDETNYWQWARHMDWGYHDQAPMVAWAIHWTTAIFGHSALSVRLPSIAAVTLASVYMVYFAQRWFGARVAWHTTLMSQSVFVLNVGGLLATADSLQGVAYLAATYHLARSFENNQWRQWLAGGVWFGFGLLSKYSVVLFLPCILLYGLFSNQHRKRLAAFRPYIGCVVGLTMFLPVIAWNYAHNWNSIRHVAFIGGADENMGVHLGFFIDYLGSQIGLLTPLVFLLITAAWIRIMRKHFPPDQWIFPYLLWTSFPVFALFGLLSLHSRVYGNWPCFGYWSAILAAAGLWSSRDTSGQKSWGSRIWPWVIGSSYGLTALVLIQVLVPILPIPSSWDRISDETQGWDLVGHQVGLVHRQMTRPEQTFIFGLSYQIASELAFYVPGQPDTVSINRWNRPNVYDYWHQDEDLLGQDGVGVLDSAHRQKRLMEVFERVDAPGKIDIFRPTLFSSPSSSVKPFKSFYIYRCYGFKGGLRWVPQRSDDIRATKP